VSLSIIPRAPSPRRQL
jgi:hypothetical protein